MTSPCLEGFTDVGFEDEMSDEMVEAREESTVDLEVPMDYGTKAIIWTDPESAKF